MFVRDEMISRIRQAIVTTLRIYRLLNRPRDVILLAYERALTHCGEIAGRRALKIYF